MLTSVLDFYYTLAYIVVTAITFPPGYCQERYSALDKSICKKGGFKRNPFDCSKFYRCVDFFGNGKDFSIYEFDCPRTTIFDEMALTCTYPALAKPPCTYLNAVVTSTPTSKPLSSTSAIPVIYPITDEPNELDEFVTTTVKGSFVNNITLSTVTSEVEDITTLVPFTDPPEEALIISTTIMETTTIVPVTAYEETFPSELLQISTESTESATSSTALTESDSVPGTTEFESLVTEQMSQYPLITDDVVTTEITNSQAVGITTDEVTQSVNQAELEEFTHMTTTENSIQLEELTPTYLPVTQSTIEQTVEPLPVPPLSASICKSVGFWRNPYDCSKFYRCVDFWGEGKSFEIFEFNCPAHTFFDEKYSVCNYQNVAFPKCVESVSSRFIHPA